MLMNDINNSMFYGAGTGKVRAVEKLQPTNGRVESPL